MHFLLTNDDGFDAEGLATLHSLLTDYGKVSVVAPRENQSWISHRVTVGRPMQLESSADNHYILNGTPADCVRVGIGYLALQPDWVVSGINSGANLGIDVYHSGTVAAAREATHLGYPAMAISHFRNGSAKLSWQLARERLARHMDTILSTPLGPARLLNINLPHPAHDSPELELRNVPLDQGTHEMNFSTNAEGVVFSGSFVRRTRTPGSDVEACLDHSCCTMSVVKLAE